MKTKFPGYFKLSESEIKEMWNNAIFTFDANILLNFYRYSDETRDEFFKIFEKIKDRIWIPHQSAQEFLENRLNVIDQQEKAYEDAISDLRSIEKKFENSRQHPFLEKSLFENFTNLSKEICKQLNSNKEFHNRRILEDDILSKIESILDNKVGNEFSIEELNLLYKEGEERFTNKIPPGFKDIGKKENTEKETKKYGDLIVWKQTIGKSKESKQPIILVTDDRKEDWWIRFKGKTISPRPELIKEFKDLTSQSFHMYQSDRFLEYAKEFLNESINEKTIEEIRELREHDEMKIINSRKKELAIDRLKQARSELLREKIYIEKEIKFYVENKENLIKNLQKQIILLKNSDPDAYDISILENLRRQIESLEGKIKELSEARESILVQETLFDNKSPTNF